MTSSSAEQEARPRPLGWVVSVVLNVVIGAVATLPFALLATTVRNVVLVPLRWAESDPAWSDPSGAQALVAVVVSVVAVAVFVAVNLVLRRVFRLPARAHWILATVVLVGVSAVQLLQPFVRL